MARFSLFGEWGALLVVSCLMAGVIVSSKIRARRFDGTFKEALLASEEVSVFVDGNVSFPGMYKVSKGTSLSSILKKAKPKAYSNLEGLALEKNIFEDGSFFVEELKEIAVQFEGPGVEPQKLSLKPRTRACDVKKRLAFKPNADFSFFKSKKKLKNGETITVGLQSSSSKKTKLLEINSQN